MCLPGLLCHLQKLHTIVGLHLLKVIAQPQLVIKSLNLGIKILILVLGCMMSQLHSISKQAGQSFSANF